MQHVEKKLWLNTIRAWAVGEELSEIADTKRFDKISITSYTPLELPDTFTLKHKHIINVYVTKPVSEIFKGFNRSTRQEVNKTYDIPELRFVMEDDNLNDTYALYEKFEYSQGRLPWRKNSFDNVKLFNAYYGSDIISAIPCYDLHPYLQVRAMSSRRYVNDLHMRKIVSYATRRLLYDICCYAHERGYIFVGLGSINDESVQKQNVSRFKGFFGGVVEDEYEYIYKSPRYELLERLVGLKLLFKKVRSRVRL